MLRSVARTPAADLALRPPDPELAQPVVKNTKTTASDEIPCRIFTFSP